MTTRSSSFSPTWDLQEPGLNRRDSRGILAVAAFDFFHRGTQGSPRLDRTRQGATAPQAAGVIHTDFQKGFIRAEIVGYEDFVAG